MNIREALINCTSPSLTLLRCAQNEISQLDKYVDDLHAELERVKLERDDVLRQLAAMKSIEHDEYEENENRKQRSPVNGL